VGASRKGFLGKITGRTDPMDRDVATAAASVACVAAGADVVRAHN
jgi:dihydropteroate synthase